MFKNTTLSYIIAEIVPVWFLYLLQYPNHSVCMCARMCIGGVGGSWCASVVLFFGITRCPKLTLYIYCPSARIQYLPKEI